MTDDDRIRVGRALRRLRGDQTQDDLAAKADMSTGTLQNIEYNKRKVSVARIERYAAALGTTTAQLLQPDIIHPQEALWRDLMRKMYALHVQLVHAQGDEMAALKQATVTLQRTHEILAELLTLAAKLAGYEKKD